MEGSLGDSSLTSKWECDRCGRLWGWLTAKAREVFENEYRECQERRCQRVLNPTFIDLVKQAIFNSGIPIVDGSIIVTASYVERGVWLKVESGKERLYRLEFVQRGDGEWVAVMRGLR